MVVSPGAARTLSGCLPRRVDSAEPSCSYTPHRWSEGIKRACPAAEQAVTAGGDPSPYSQCPWGKFIPCFRARREVPSVGRRCYAVLLRWTAWKAVLPGERGLTPSLANRDRMAP